jgi:hypothetical protein
MLTPKINLFDIANKSVTRSDFYRAMLAAVAGSALALSLRGSQAGHSALSACILPVSAALLDAVRERSRCYLAISPLTPKDRLRCQRDVHSLQLGTHRTV